MLLRCWHCFQATKSEMIYETTVKC